MSEQGPQGTGDGAKPAGEQPAGAAAGGRKELEGFQVRITRDPPAAAGGPSMGMFLVGLVLLGVLGFGIVKSVQGPSKDAKDDGGADTTNGGEGDQPDLPADEPVPDWVWSRLEFLEGEGNLAKALEVAEEQLKVGPNRELQARVRGYRKDLGIEETPKTNAQLLNEAQAELKRRNYLDAIDLVDIVLEQDPRNAKALRIRGEAVGRNGDPLGAQSDLKAALELGYQPAAEVERLLKEFE